MFLHLITNISCNLNCISIKQALIILLLILIGSEIKSQIPNSDSVFQASPSKKNTLLGSSLLQKSKSKKDNFKIGGGIFVEAQAAKSQYDFQQTPLNYVRTTLTPVISLWGIPFTTQINLSTEQFQTSYNLNRFQLALDINSLSKIYKQKLLERLEENTSDTSNINKYKSILQDSVEKIKNIDLQRNAIKSSNDSNEAELYKLEAQYGFGNNDSLKEIGLNDRIKYKEYLKGREKLKQDKQLYDSLSRITKNRKKLEEDLQNYIAFYENKAPKQIQDLKQNPNQQALNKYRNHKYLSKAEKFILSVRNFKAGTIYTGSSNSNLQGATINGISLENSFGKFYTAIQAGSLQQNLGFGQLNQVKNNNYLYSVKGGYGMPENTHLHLGVLRSGKIGKAEKQDKQSIIPTIENATIYSLDGALNIGSNLLLEGEWALANNQQSFGSTKNTEAYATSTLANQYLQKPNTSYLVKATSNLFNGKTKLTAQQQYIGANFSTPGNIFLRNDIKRQAVKISQKLYKSYLSVDLSYQNDEDNLLNQKSHTTTVNNYKGALKIRLKKLPSFIVSYTLIKQLTASNTSEQKFSYLNTIKVYSITSVYNKRIKKNILTSSLTYIHQDLNNNFSSIKRVYNNITALSSLASSNGDNLTWVGALSNSVSQQNTFMLNNQLEASYVHRKNNSFITTIGGYYTYDNFLGDNGGGFLRQVLSFWKKNSIALLIKQNFFKGTSAASKTIHQSIINIQFTQQW